MGVFGQTSRQYQRKRYVGPKRAFNRMRYYANLNKKRKMAKKAYRKPGQARPMSDLRLTYKGIPNQYRFCREEVSSVIDIHDSLVSAAGTISVVNLDNFKMNLLSNFVTEFSPLFANYKLDMLVFYLNPLFTVSTGEAFATGGVSTPELNITRINTKYLNVPLNLGTTDAAVRAALAQLQMKTTSRYGTKYPLKLITKYPRIFQVIQPTQGVGGVSSEFVTEPGKWLDIRNSSDVEFGTNHSLVFQKRDQSAIQAGVYKYQLVTKAYFRCSQVG